ncbi:MAG: hypothetical protein LBP28_06205, partial [Coriobacteriales bacterium]|nr:hypothetical protein [Coriobacteriales bacterium]
MRQIWDADRGSLWGEPRLAVAAIGVAVASTALFATLLAAPIDPVLALFTAKSAIATNTMIIADYPVPHRAPQPRSGALALPAEVEGSTAPAASEEAPAPQLAGGEAPQRSEAGEETPSRSAAGGEEQSRNATAEEAQAHNAA